MAADANSFRMKHPFKALGLLLLLIAAQQGAVVHELSHVVRTNDAELRVEPGGGADTVCALCPAFAQTVTPAFSHSFEIPVLERAAAELCSEPLIFAIDAQAPRPRSRGPPFVS